MFNKNSIAMKTEARDFISYYNVTLVQLSHSPKTRYPFMPGGPEMQRGGLIITESNPGGVVGALIAENRTDTSLLLTDADLLSGAKQNRVLNKSQLIPPHSKQRIDVSCVERMRWHYTSPTFSDKPTVADIELRKQKIMSETKKMKNEAADIQGEVWAHVKLRMNTDMVMSKTEDYLHIVDQDLKIKQEKFPKYEPAPECTGLAILFDGEVKSVDLFGSVEVYRHYFPKLRDTAFSRANSRIRLKTDMHEVYYKSLEMVDRFNSGQRTEDKTYDGEGKFFFVEADEITGFSLLCHDQLIHNVVFAK